MPTGGEKGPPPEHALPWRMSNDDRALQCVFLSNYREWWYERRAQAIRPKRRRWYAVHHTGSVCVLALSGNTHWECFERFITVASHGRTGESESYR
eukprot:gene15651-biopygen5203